MGAFAFEEERAAFLRGVEDDIEGREAKVLSEPNLSSETERKGHANLRLVFVHLYSTLRRAV
jgi:hypothetical protein